MCYSVEAPHLELIQEVPGSVWECNEHSNLHHIGFWSDDLAADGATWPSSGCPLQLCGRPETEAPVSFAYHRNDLGVRIEIVDSRHARGHGVPVPAGRELTEPSPVRQVRVHGPGDVRVDEVPEPEPGPRDVVVRVAACGICGSDLTYIKMGGLAGPGGAPMCLGHEMAGVVDRVGAEVATAASATGSWSSRATTSSGGSGTVPPRAD